MPTNIIDTTFTGKNISSAASVYEYTATYDCTIRVQVRLAAVAGSGDYVAYLTLNDGDAQSDDIVEPKTTATLASGETACWLTTTSVDVLTGDVINVFVDGLAGDTSEAGSIRIFADNYLAPTTANRTLDVTATGAAGIDWSNIENKTATVDLTATTTNDDANVWAYASRTLTQTAASVAAAVDGTSITCRRGDTLSAALTDVGALTNYSSLYFTVKDNETDADSASIIMVKKNLSGTSDGLIYLNGAAGTAGNGSITIDDSATGDITIALTAATTALLAVGTYHYDVQIVRSSGTAVSTLTVGAFAVVEDYTKATA